MLIFCKTLLTQQRPNEQYSHWFRLKLYAYDYKKNWTGTRFDQIENRMFIG